jgi:hypothetical protein
MSDGGCGELIFATVARAGEAVGNAISVAMNR